MIEALLQAERLLVHGLVDQAERIYAGAARADPRNAIAVVGLARVALERGDERLAYERACEALEIDPENAAALRLEARLSRSSRHAASRCSARLRGHEPTARRAANRAAAGRTRQCRSGRPSIRAARLHAQPVDGRTSAHGRESPAGERSRADQTRASREPERRPGCGGGSSATRRTTQAVRVLVTGGAGYVGSITASGWSRPATRSSCSTRCCAATAPPSRRRHAGRSATSATRRLVERTLREHAIEAVLHCAGRALVGESVVQPDALLPRQRGRRPGAARRDARGRRAAHRLLVERRGLRRARDLADRGRPRRCGRSIRTARPSAPSRACSTGTPEPTTWPPSRCATSTSAGATDERGEDHEPETHLIPNMLAASRGGAPLKVFGTDYPTPDGTCVRDYIHVDDLADAHVAALELTADVRASHMACNLGSGSGFSVLEVLTAAEIGRRSVGAARAVRRDAKAIRRCSSHPTSGRASCSAGSRGAARSSEMIGSAWRWRQRNPTATMRAQ